MTDRELLEAAAKAAGLLLHDGTHVWMEGAGQWARWNPLTDDGDALRLAVALNIGPQPRAFSGDSSLAGRGKYCIVESHNGDPLAATRRAIVRAAAEIGREA